MKTEIKDRNSLQRLVGKKILFVLCGFELGGAERQALHLACYLKQHGCDVRVWGHHHHKTGPERVIELCEEADIPWAEHKFRWPCGKLAFLRDAWGLLRALLRERPDVILPYTTWPNVGCNFIVRYVCHSICIWGQRDIAPLRGGWIEKMAVRRASAVICNARHEVDHLRRALGNLPAPVFVVHNGVDMALPLSTREEWRAKLGINDDVVVAVMLANLRCDKDHVTLLHAWSKLLDVESINCDRIHLILAGAFQESHDAICGLAVSLKLDGKISFTGHVHDVSGLLAACDVGILMTDAEGLPNAVLEYMASGLPVVATDVPGNREALGLSGDHLLCKPGAVDELARLLSVIVDNQELRENLGRNNKQRADDCFSIDIMCSESVNIIADLLP